jgi:hypothetical protein
MKEETLGPGWSGIVTRDVIAPLAQAIERQFGNNKYFSSMYDHYYRASPFPRYKGASADVHRQLDEIKPFLDESEPFIWIIVRNQWSIHLDTFVCLTQRSILVERTHGDGSYEVWCWMLEE